MDAKTRIANAFAREGVSFYDLMPSLISEILATPGFELPDNCAELAAASGNVVINKTQMESLNNALS